MKLIYTGRTNADAHLLAAILAERGIERCAMNGPPHPTAGGALARRTLGDEFPWATLLVTAVCVVVWHGLSLEPRPDAHEALSKWGCRSASDVWDGAYWSLLTSCFAHSDAEHLWGNMLWLWAFGIPLERAFGPARWLAFMLVAGTLANAVDQGWKGIACNGFSGVTNAAFGLLVVSQVRIRLLPWWVLVPLSAYFVVGTYDDVADLVSELRGIPIAADLEVANIAHLSGLAFGLLTGLAFVLRSRPRLAALGLAGLAALAVVPLFWMPWGDQWLIHQAARAERAGDVTAAIALLDRAERVRPLFSDIPATRAQTRLAIPDFDKALADAHRAVELDATSTFARSVRASVFAQLGRYEEALADLDESLRLRDDEAFDWAARAAVRLELCELEEADIDATEALFLAPTDARAQIVRGAARRRMGEPIGARDDLEDAISRLHPPDTEPPQDVVKLADLGQASVELGEFDAADDYYTQALALVPHDWGLMVGRALARVGMRRYDAARQDALLGLAVNPRSTDGHYANGLAELGLGRRNEALAAFNRALALNPRMAPAQVARSMALRATGDNEGALAASDEAIALHPKSPEALTERGRCLRALGRNEEAEAAERAAILLNPPR